MTPIPSVRWIAPAAIAAGLLVLGGGTWAALSLLQPTAVDQPITAPATREPLGPEPTTAPSAASGIQPTPTPTPAPGPMALPERCDDLFSDAMVETLTGQYQVSLNPEWSRQPDAVPLPTSDPALDALIGEQPRLNCNWMPGGGGHTGIITAIASVDDAEAAAVEERLANLYSPVQETFGTRYIWEDWETAAGGSVGESHLVREGLWFATRWLNIPVGGYTAEMVERVVG